MLAEAQRLAEAANARAAHARRDADAASARAASVLAAADASAADLVAARREAGDAAAAAADARAEARSLRAALDAAGGAAGPPAGAAGAALASVAARAAAAEDAVGALRGELAAEVRARAAAEARAAEHYRAHTMMQASAQEQVESLLAQLHVQESAIKRLARGVAGASPRTRAAAVAVLSGAALGLEEAEWGGAGERAKVERGTDAATDAAAPHHPPTFDPALAQQAGAPPPGYTAFLTPRRQQRAPRAVDPDAALREICDLAGAASAPASRVVSAAATPRGAGQAGVLAAAAERAAAARVRAAAPEPSPPARRPSSAPGMARLRAALHLSPAKERVHGGKPPQAPRFAARATVVAVAAPAPPSPPMEITACRVVEDKVTAARLDAAAAAPRAPPPPAPLSDSSSSAPTGKTTAAVYSPSGNSPAAAATGGSPVRASALPRAPFAAPPRRAAASPSPQRKPRGLSASVLASPDWLAKLPARPKGWALGRAADPGDTLPAWLPGVGSATPSSATSSPGASSVRRGLFPGGVE